MQYMYFDTYLCKTIFFLLCIKYVYLYEINNVQDDYDNYDDIDVEVSFRIVGGEIAREVYPFLVSIQMYGKHSCGGSIIASNWILTAAHCLVKDVNSGSRSTINPRYCQIIANSANLNQLSKAVFRLCAKLHVHPHYRFTLNDIGLISLTQPLYLKPIQLAPTAMFERSLRSLQRTTCNVMGWGAWREDVLSSTHLLKEVKLQLMSGLKCKSYFRHGVIAMDKQLCTLESGKDACRGDSGGPMVCNGYQYGIVSWGHGCARDQNPGVYTRVDYYTGWIRMVMSSCNKLTYNVYLLFIIIIIQRYFTILFL